MNSSDSENDDICTTQDVLEETKITSITLLPEKSRKKYESVYKAFMDWRSKNNVDSFSENVLLSYFGELAEKYKSSSLWAHYSMLRSTLNLNDGINIELYSRLRAYLKRKAEGYHAKKAKSFTQKEIDKFINDAPDEVYLLTKVALIMGIMGACRKYELYSMSIEDLQDLGTAMLVTIPNTAAKAVRKFMITGRYYELCKKYIDLRPAIVPCNSFFLNYHNGKCIEQKVGINKFGAMGKQIAAYLKLPNPEMYTGHSFRSSSTKLNIDASVDIAALKRHGGWKISSVAEEYLDDLIKREVDTENESNQSVQDNPSTTFNYTQEASTTNESAGSLPSVHFTNCSNITINFITNKRDK